VRIEAITLHRKGSLSSLHTVNAGKRRMKTGPGLSVNFAGECARLRSMECWYLIEAAGVTAETAED